MDAMDEQTQMAIAIGTVACHVNALFKLLVKKNIISEEEHQRIRDTAVEDIKKAFQED